MFWFNMKAEKTFIVFKTFGFLMDRRIITDKDFAKSTERQNAICTLWPNTFPSDCKSPSP